MKLCFAPMEGVTGASYRRIHREMFPGADRYYAPFIAPDSQGNFRLKHLRDVLPDSNRGIALVPQILANSAEAFLSVAAQLKELGYEEVNLNAGCPSGTVVSKHKGAGMLSDLTSLDAFLSRVFEAAPVKVSVKTRMGMNSTGEFPPRVRLGRGAAANPALFRVLKGGPALGRDELREFHDRLLDDALSSGLSPHYAMARMKELWYYMIWMFPDSAREFKALNKSRSLEEYRSAVSLLFSACPFDPDTGFGG